MQCHLYRRINFYKKVHSKISANKCYTHEDQFLLVTGNVNLRSRLTTLYGEHNIAENKNLKLKIEN